MSKSVRLSDYLYAEVERLAAEERRSLANMVQVLLEKALTMDKDKQARIAEDDEKVIGDYARLPALADAPSRRIEADAVDPYFKPDPK